MLGNSSDVSRCEFSAVLNVTVDYWPIHYSTEIEYATVGLIDGPGNDLAAYHAAVLKLCSLLRHHTVLVHDHNGASQAVAVCIMTLHLLHRRGWTYWQEKIGREPHEAHKHAFNRMNWRLLTSVLEAQ